MLRLEAGGFIASIVVEVKPALTPQEASDLLRGFGRALRSISSGTALLIVAPWLSARTREILAREGINYIDLTGNARVRLDNPALFIETVGSSRNPEPEKRGGARVRGPKAARLIRLLLDVRPPYGVGEIAEATGLAPGYVSRLLDTLYREALIERPARGAIEDVDVPGLIQRWATSYDVLRSNAPMSFIAPAGRSVLLRELANYPSEAPRFALTGSTAASRLAPIAAPALLLAYCDAPESLAKELGLLPAEEGADVVFLKPYDPVVWRGNSTADGLRFAAPSQVAVDCLTGNGRMPAEGEALLGWMRDNESDWRLPAIGRWDEW